MLKILLTGLALSCVVPLATAETHLYEDDMKNVIYGAEVYKDGIRLMTVNGISIIKNGALGRETSTGSFLNHSFVTVACEQGKRLEISSEQVPLGFKVSLLPSSEGYGDMLLTFKTVDENYPYEENLKSLKGQSVDHCSTIVAPESLIYEKSVHVQVQNTDATKVHLGGGYHAVYKVHVQDS